MRESNKILVLILSMFLIFPCFLNEARADSYSFCWKQLKSLLKEFGKVYGDFADQYEKKGETLVHDFTALYFPDVSYSRELIENVKEETYSFKSEQEVCSDRSRVYEAINSIKMFGHRVKKYQNDIKALMDGSAGLAYCIHELIRGDRTPGSLEKAVELTATFYDDIVPDYFDLVRDNSYLEDRPSLLYGGIMGRIDDMAMECIDYRESSKKEDRIDLDDVTIDGAISSYLDGKEYDEQVMVSTTVALKRIAFPKIEKIRVPFSINSSILFLFIGPGIEVAFFKIYEMTDGTKYLAPYDAGLGIDVGFGLPAISFNSYSNTYADGATRWGRCQVNGNANEPRQENGQRPSFDFLAALFIGFRDIGDDVDIMNGLKMFKDLKNADGIAFGFGMIDRTSQIGVSATIPKKLACDKENYLRGFPRPDGKPWIDN